jgi:hypothetical protein
LGNLVIHGEPEQVVEFERLKPTPFNSHGTSKKKQSWYALFNMGGKGEV